MGSVAACCPWTTDDLAFGVLVGLGPADGEQDAAGLVPNVGQRECDQLGASHRGREPEQDDRGVAGALGAAAVDGVEDLADVLGSQWPGLASRCGADEAAQSSPDLPHALGQDRVV